MAIDLTNVPERYKLEITSVEITEERVSRLRREEADAAHQRWKSTGLFAVGIIVALIVGGLCLWASLDRGFTTDQQRWASSLLTSMMTGIIGYITGKNSK